MHLGVGDCYTLSGNHYTKHVNVQVIGVDSKQPYREQNNREPSSYSIDNGMKNQRVIKQDDMQYEQHQSIQDLHLSKQKLTKNTKLRNRSEESQLYSRERIIPNLKLLTSSCVANDGVKDKLILKQRLTQIPKIELKSQYQEDSSADDRNIYIELQKERKLRIDLQKSYKNLLSQVYRNEGYYSMDYVDQNEGQYTHTKRFSKRTLNQNTQDRIQQQELLPNRRKLGKYSAKKTVRNKLNQEYQLNYAESEVQRENNQRVVDQNNQYQLNQNQVSSRRKSIILQYQDNQNYFKYQRQFQQRILQNMNILNYKIQQIDSYLIEKQQGRQKQELLRQIALKQAEINWLKQQKRNNGYNVQSKKQNGQNSHADQVNNFIHNLSSTSLYAICILIMALVVIT